jgi:hypothetical protein
VNRSILTTVLCGAVSVLLGSFYLLQGAGVIVMAPPAHDGDNGLALCVGAAFIAGGAATILTTVRGPFAQTAINLLALVIVVCFAAIGGWIALGPGEHGFASPFAIFGHRANEISGRIAFGLGALISLAIAMAMARGLVQALRTAVSSHNSAQPEG